MMRIKSFDIVQQNGADILCFFSSTVAAGTCSMISSQIYASNSFEYNMNAEACKTKLMCLCFVYDQANMSMIDTHI